MKFFVVILRDLRNFLFVKNRALLRCKDYQIIPLRLTHSDDDKTSFLSSLLGISRTQASKLLTQNQVLRQLNDSRLKKIYSCLLNMKLDLTQILTKPQVFNYLPNTLEQRYQCLREIGFNDISVTHLLKYNTIMRCTVAALQQRKFLKSNVDPLKEILSHTNDPKYLMEMVRKNHGDVNRSSVGVIRHVAMVEYLSWVLGTSSWEIKSIFEKYPKLKTRSLCSIIRTYVALSRDLEFSNLKIRQYVQLLSHSAGDIHEKLAEFNLLAGVGYKWLANKHPKLLSIPIYQLQNVLKQLSDFDVTNEQIVVCSKVLLLPPSTMQRRIQNIKKDPAIDRYRNHPQFLELLCTTRENIQKWTKQFDEEIETLSTTRPTLRHIEYFYTTSKHMEVILYLTDCLGLPQALVQEKLQPYPQWMWANLLNASYVLSLLMQKGFNREQIILGLPVLLYNRKSVEIHLVALGSEKLGEDIRNPFFLRKVLNSMEQKNYLSDARVIEYTSETLKTKSMSVLQQKHLKKLLQNCFNQDRKE